MTKRLAIWNQPFQASWRGLFVGILKAGGSLSTEGIAGLPGAGAHLIEAVGLETSLEERAYLLVRRAMTRAVVELTVEAASVFERQKVVEQTALAAFDEAFEEQELTLEPWFFDRPRDLELVEILREPFRDFLLGYGLELARADNLADRLPTYFTWALAVEWADQTEVYEPLRTHLDGPFAKAAARERGWFLYERWLERQIDEPVFGESFSLKQIYVELRCYTEHEVEDSETANERHGRHRLGLSGVDRPDAEDRPTWRRVQWLDKHLVQWLDESEPEAAVRALSGGPGSGKSSFAKMFAVKATDKGWRVVLVPLHRIEPDRDVGETLEGFVANDPFLEGNPLDAKNGENRLLLIFDGLDELAKQGEMGERVASDFVRDVQQQTEIRRGQKKDVRALFTGRPVAVPGRGGPLRKEGQVIHLLPYWLDRSPADRYEDPEGLLHADQRAEWWSKYRSLTGRELNGLPNELRQGKHLDDLTAQPLLNYLVALSWSRGDVEFGSETNLNEIYADLLEKIYERVWGEPDQKEHGGVKGLTREQFARILEEIAVAAWHGNGRTVTVREVETRCGAVGLKGLLERFRERSGGDIDRLFLAFYFRRSGQQRDAQEAFEFTHKSFAEYLVARYLVGVARDFTARLGKSAGKYQPPESEEKLLVEWAELCGPTAIGWNELAFLRREAQNYPEEAAAHQRTLARLLTWVQRHDLPMERVQGEHRFGVLRDRARNAEETLLAVLDAFARVSGERSEVEWPENERTALGNMICRLRGQRGGDRELSLTLLRSLPFGGQFLWGADLWRADLTGAVLTGADLTGADLWRADLTGAVLTGAVLRGADLREADLRGAVLRGAVLWGADLTYFKGSPSGLPLNQAFRVRRQDLLDAGFDPEDFSKAIFEDDPEVASPDPEDEEDS